MSLRLAAVAAWLVACPVARADVAEPSVRLEFEGPWPEALAREVRAELGVALGERSLSLVDRFAQARPSAAIHLHLLDDPRRVLIEVDDLVNDKRVDRVVRLGDEPADTWGTQLALAADELVRAAWVEISIADAPAPRLEPPAAVVAAVDEALTPARAVRERPFLLEVGPASEWYLDGASLFGLDLSFGYRFEVLMFELALVLRASVPAESALGSVYGWSVGGAAAVYLDLVAEPAWSLQLLAAARVLAIDWVPAPAAGAVGAGHVAPFVGLAGGLRIAGRIDDLLLGLRATVGAPPLAAVARAEGPEPVVAVRGLEVGVRLEVGWSP